MLRRLRVWLRLLLRRGRLLWRCPQCLRVSRWGQEHPFDLYPMLLGLDSKPACCAREFPRWAYSQQ